MIVSRRHLLDLELDQYILGNLSDPNGEVIEHLISCKYCKYRLEQFRSSYQSFLEKNFSRGFRSNGENHGRT